MGKLITKIKSSKLLNSGAIKKVKDKIYFKYINPREEKRTDKYREEIIKKFGEICKDCHWILFAGSILRYHRDNTMDGQDLDFLIERKDFDKVKNQFLKEGFKIHQAFVNNKKVLTEYRLDYKGVEVDVFLADKDKKCYVASSTMEKINAKDFTKKVIGNTQVISGKDIVSYVRKQPFFDEVADYEFKGVKFKGPKDIEKAIYDLYGETWTFYDPTYDPRTCPKHNLPVANPNATSYVYIKPLTSFDDLFKDVENS